MVEVAGKPPPFPPCLSRCLSPWVQGSGCGNSSIDDVDDSPSIPVVSPRQKSLSLIPRPPSRGRSVPHLKSCSVNLLDSWGKRVKSFVNLFTLSIFWRTSSLLKVNIKFFKILSL